MTLVLNKDVRLDVKVNLTKQNLTRKFACIATKLHKSKIQL
jgi:hypothetical protein